MLIHRNIRSAIHLIIIISLLSVFTTNGEDATHLTATNPPGLKLKPITPIKLPAIPVIRNMTNHLDNIHDGTYLRLQRSVNSFDTFFAKNKAERIEIPMSRFRLGTYLVVEDKDDKVSTKLEPDFEADLDLPNIEHRFGLFINSFRSEDLPGVDPVERKSSISVGLQHILEDLHLHSRIGVKWRDAPVGIAKTEWRPKYSIGKMTIYPRQRIFYETDDGLGELTSLTLNRWLGRNFARLVSAGKWTEQTTGIEWEQSFLLGHVIKRIEESKTADIVSNDDVAQGFGVRYSIFGHNSTDEQLVDRHRLTFIYRHPLYQNWLFFQVAPGIEWRNEDEWDPIPSIQFGLDTLFWELTQK
ncbi:MAG: hypothetical protein A2283_18780 [Lentisphaerae bacterium RIFOXYA12_FULL_48_11]|nr:MAG: hypothetical protein A2283_18780 [Lentisphaerae bacterium RIFOXYA12_FULL_48_11]